MTTLPKWMTQHPCASCGAGYGACIRGPERCCGSCSHPTRWTASYTKDEIAEMQRHRANGVC